MPSYCKGTEKRKEEHVAAETHEKEREIQNSSAAYVMSLVFAHVSGDEQTEREVMLTE